MTIPQRIWTVTQVAFARMRFVLIFAIAALLVGYWDHIKAHVDRWMRPNANFAAAESFDEWYCPMHPTVIRSQPGVCPQCNMELSKRDKRTRQNAVTDRVQLTPWRMSLADVATTPVAYRPLTRQVRALGVMDYDETRVANIAARVAGRADELFLTYTGQSVKAGDPVYSLYSPEVFTAQREYLQARKRVNDLPADAPQEVRADASTVYNASMQKLVLWGMTRQELDKLDKEFDTTQKVPTNFTVTSPITGIVARKDINPGQYLQVGQSAYTVADLSTLWLRAKIYEADIPLVKIGQKVQVVVDALPSETFSAKVTFLSYALDPETRTLDARIEVPNKELLIRPGMFATATISVPISASTRPATAPTTRPANGHATMDGPNDDAHARVLQKALEPYLKAADLLAHDKAEGVADLLQQSVAVFAKEGDDPRLKDAYDRLTAAVKETPGQDLKTVRKTFKKVSVALMDLSKVTGLPMDAPAVQIYRCPMRDKPYWLQVSGPTANPYYGSEMFDCGGPVEPLPRAQPAAPAHADHADHGAHLLAIPRSAVIDTGTRKIVFVESAARAFDMKEVKTGPLSSDDYYPVLEGLKEGDRVVTRGAFLLDSENRLNPAAPKTTDVAGEKAPATPSGGHKH